MITDFVTSYGYFAVFVGTLLEGETILIIAGFAAHLGLLNWGTVVVVAAAGATLGDQLAFILGRWKGTILIRHFPSLALHKQRIDNLLAQHAAIFIFSVRFIYGLRIAGPLIIGASRVPVLRFVAFNVAGASIWALLVTGLGYTFGLALNVLFDDIKRVADIAIIVILLLSLSFWLWHGHLMNKKSKLRK
jgi:membrane protein DedA with SNARE-associated domain